MRHWKPNQKLTDSQIATIKHLKDSGIALYQIACVLEERYGVSKTTAYYHAADNREPYRRKTIDEEKLEQKAMIRAMIQGGMTTSDIAELWEESLAKINKIYTT